MTELEDDLLQRAAMGEIAADSKEMAELFARRPEAKRRFEEMRAMMRTLDAAAAEERAATEHARGETTERDRLAVAAALRDGRVSVLEDERRSRSSPRTAMKLVAAAALVLTVAAAAWLLRGPKHDGDGRDVPLGTGGVSCIAPKGDVEEWKQFEFTLQEHANPATRYVVRVKGTDPRGGVDKLLIQSEPLESSPWIPPQNELQKLGDEIVWYVIVMDPAAPSTASPSVSARRVH